MSFFLRVLCGEHFFPEVGRVEYRELPNGGVKLSAVVTGCWQFAGGSSWGEYPQEQADAVVAACLEEGINTFDTAEVYGRGRSEEALRDALAASGARREDYILATKTNTRDFRYETVSGRLEGSLRRLGVEYVDIYQIHWPPVPFEKDRARLLVETARKLLEAGKVRAMATSNFRVHDLEVFDELSWMASNQIPYSLLWRYYDVEGAVEKSAGAGVGHLAYSSLAQGLLTGRFGTGYVPPEGHTRSRNRLWRKPIYPEALRVVDVLKEAAEKTGRSCAQVAVNWVVSRPGNFAAIVGARNVEQVKSNAGAVGWTLDEELGRSLDEASLRFQKENLRPEFFKMWGD